jgi:hypothetical protein
MTVPVFAALSTLPCNVRRDGLQWHSTNARIVDFMREEGGCWTAAGVAAALALPYKSTGARIGQLMRSGHVRKVRLLDRPDGAGGRRVAVYEAVE